MGYALIVGGGTDGRYTIEIDIGEAQRTALVEKFTERAAEAQAKLAASQATLAEKRSLLDAAALVYNDATTAYIEVLRGEGDVQDGDEYLAIVNGHAKAQADYIAALTAHSAALANRNALSLSATTITKALAGWQAQVLTETRDAWCTDLTEDATGYVATMEIPGESGLILLAPGGRSPVLATDGRLFSRGLMSPWQAYFNAAVLPGWQKFKPTYRWGTITTLNENDDTATVSLSEAHSSAQHLLVNQATTLQNVPVVYMECNAAAFGIGDEVIVEFQGQNWSAPRVIGFLDNPRPCLPWPDVLIDATPYFKETITAATGTKNWVSNISETVCDFLLVFQSPNEPVDSVDRWFTVYENPRFVDPSVEDDGFVIESSLPEVREWGTSNNSGGGVGFKAPAGSSPGVALVEDGGFIYKKEAPYSSVTYPDAGLFPPDFPCTVTSTYTGFMWDNQPVGPEYGKFDAYNLYGSSTLLGRYAMQSIIYVRRGGTKKRYRFKAGTLGVGSLRVWRFEVDPIQA